MVNMLLPEDPARDFRRSCPRDPGRQGFSIIEVVVAIVVLAVGLLGAAGTTLLVVRQTTLSDLASDRSAAIQTTVEQLRAVPFDSLSSGNDSIGAFAVSWTVTSADSRWKHVEIITTGPGISTESGSPIIVHSIPDTLTYRILQ